MKTTIVINLFAIIFLTSCGIISSGDNENDRLSWESGVEVATLTGKQDGYMDGELSIALFSGPVDINIDNNQDFFVVDGWNHVIRKIGSDGIVSTWAGKKPEAGDLITFWPKKTAVGNNDELYITQAGSYQIYHVTEDTIYSLTGSERGDIDGSLEKAQFSTINDLTVASDGSIYISMGFYADESHKIKRITPNGIVETLAGTNEIGHQDGPGQQAVFNSPKGLALGPQEKILYIASSWTIRTIDLSSGEVQTLAGIPPEREYVYRENRDGTLSEAVFTGDISSITLGNDRTIFFLQSGYNLVRKISPEGMVTTIAGQDTPLGGFQDGRGDDAKFNNPRALAIDPEGNLYLADSGNDCIRMITFNN